MKKKEWIPYLIGLTALLIGAFYDYQITDFLYHKGSLLGIFFERIVLLPVQLVVVITMCIYAKQRSKLCLLLAQAASTYLCVDFAEYWVNLDTYLLLIVGGISVLITAIVYMIILRIPQYLLQKYQNFFLFFTCVLLTSILITTLIKKGWGRIRYRDLRDASQFCVWYQPCLLFGNTSFPSGHTTAFTAILCFLQLKQHPQQKVPALRYIGIGILLLLMPITRMIMGAHFLSDTAMGFMITYSCYLFYRYQFVRGGRL